MESLCIHSLQCRPQSDCSRAARPGIPTSGHTQDSFRMAAPHPHPLGPQEVTSHRRWAAVWRRHCTAVPSVVFSSACSDWTYAGHHLLCPLLTTMLAKSRSQTEWVSPQRADRHYVPPPILLCGLSDVEAFDQNYLGQRRREQHREWGHHESVAWRATEAETFVI